MHETDTDDEDCFEEFLVYTREWVNRVNRGGLHRVTDETFLLFRSMELTVRNYLIGTKISIDEAIDELDVKFRFFPQEIFLFSRQSFACSKQEILRKKQYF